jgi:hypothetical protein
MKKLSASFFPFFLTVSVLTLQATAELDFNIFFMPLRLQSQGMEQFMSLYNQKTYSELLPESFTHLLQFLDHGRQTKQGRYYAREAIDLFLTKLKSCDYVNAYCWSDLLAELPLQLGLYFEQQPTRNGQSQKQAIKETLYTNFLNNYSALKENPALFFDSLADEIVQHVSPDNTDEASCQELRQTLMCFLELGTNKILWEVGDKDLWKSVKRIAEHLSDLNSRKIISELDLNDLYWSLVYRLCHFVELAGTQLPNEFYQEAQQDLTSRSLLFLSLPERETLETPKHEVLARAIADGFIKKQAEANGILVAKS